MARMRIKATYHSTKNQMTCVFEGSRDGGACKQCCSSLATPAYVTMISLHYDHSYLQYA